MLQIPLWPRRVLILGAILALGSLFLLGSTSGPQGPLRPHHDSTYSFEPSGTFDTVRSSVDTVISIYPYPCPDSVRIIFIPTLDDKRLGFGISTGVSATQWITGDVVFGIYVGIGFNFNVFEFP